MLRFNRYFLNRKIYKFHFGISKLKQCIAMLKYILSESFIKFWKAISLPHLNQTLFCCVYVHVHFLSISPFLYAYIYGLPCTQFVFINMAKIIAMLKYDTSESLASNKNQNNMQETELPELTGNVENLGLGRFFSHFCIFVMWRVYLFESL